MSIINKVFFVENMSESEAENIKILLETNTRVDFTINPSTQSIAIKASNDDIFTTKQLLKSEGYSIL